MAARGADLSRAVPKIGSPIAPMAAAAQTSGPKATRQSDVIYGRKFGVALTMEVFTVRWPVRSGTTNSTGRRGASATIAAGRARRPDRYIRGPATEPCRRFRDCTMGAAGRRFSAGDRRTHHGHLLSYLLPLDLRQSFQKAQSRSQGVTWTNGALPQRSSTISWPNSGCSPT
jgi:hypothetical protein